MFGMRVVIVVFLLAISQLWCRFTTADTLIVPNSTRGTARIHAFYRFDHPVTGIAKVDVEWTDALGRIVDRRQLQFMLSHAQQFRFALNPGRAAAVKNKLAVRVALHRRSQGRSVSKQEHAATTSFYVS